MDSCLDPVFIVGVGRSGTSLLQSMLHAHPDVAFLPETHFFRRYIARRFNRWRVERAGTQALFSTLLDDEEFQRANIPVEDVLFSHSNDGGECSVVDVYAQLLRRYGEREEVSIVGEKDPRLIDYLPQLKDAFPEARVVHILRDPRDVLLSRMNARWSADRPDWLHMLTYRAQLARGCRQGRHAFRSKYMEVRYEDLLSEPECVLRNVAEHIGVTYSDTMLAFQRSAEELVHESERDWKKETTGPLLCDNTGKWRNELSGWQVRLTERVCRKAFECFDYQQAESPMKMSRVQRIALRLAPTIGTGFEYLYALACRFR